MYFIRNSPNPETIDLFRSTYYLPKFTLWLLLFIVFPTTDPSITSIHQSNNINHKHPSEHSITLSSKKTTTPTQSTATTNLVHHSSCPDAYLDHRNNLICPHAPKQLKSVRQRFSQVLLEFKISIIRVLSSSSSASASSPSPSSFTQTCFKHTDHQTQFINPIQHLNPTKLINSSILRIILCAPLSNPFLHLIIILHILLIIQALSLLIEDALIKDACYSHQSHSFRKSTSWPKIWSRFQFRFRKQWSQRAFLEPFLIWLFALTLLFIITRETIGETDSWSTGLIWHDLPFRNRCRPPTQHSKLYPHQKSTISLITSPTLRFLSFFLDRPPFLKPARSLILLECFLTFICLLQPAQHILPSKILPKSIKIPQAILIFRKNKSFAKLRHHHHEYHHLNFEHQNFNPHLNNQLFNLDSYPFSDNGSFNQRITVPVEVETKWFLGILVEACLGLTSILAYFIVMVHLPYASHYSIAFFLTIYSIKSTCRKMKKLMSTTINTIDCLQVVLMEFSERKASKLKIRRRGIKNIGEERQNESADLTLNKNQTDQEEEEEEEEEEDWTCSICFEDSDDRSDSSLSSTDPNQKREHHTSIDQPNSNNKLTNTYSSKQQEEQERRRRSRRRLAKKRLSNRCILNCHHSYHTTCLVKWLHYQSFCPICHREVL